MIPKFSNWFQNDPKISKIIDFLQTAKFEIIQKFVFQIQSNSKKFRKIPIVSGYSKRLEVYSGKFQRIRRVFKRIRPFPVDFRSASYLFNRLPVSVVSVSSSSGQFFRWGHQNVIWLTLDLLVYLHVISLWFSFSQFIIDSKSDFVTDCKTD